MQTTILGDGGMGRAIADALTARGGPVPIVLGRPRIATGRHAAASLPGAASGVVVEVSRGAAVPDNVGAALAAGCRRFVIVTTGWDDDRRAVEAAISRAGATAVVAPNFSPGVVLFGRLVEEATRLFGSLAEFDPYLVEWHRRTKTDRPSGTARELARRILTTHPAKTRLADPSGDGPPAADELDVAVIRAGTAPGMHLVGFDAPGETVELRLTARDRSAYAAGVLAAIDWLGADGRPVGLIPFDPVVVDELIARRSTTAAPAA